MNKDELNMLRQALQAAFDTGQFDRDQFQAMALNLGFALAPTRRATLFDPTTLQPK